ncbi:ElyC/SanA/YdcF family protein [Halomonas cerina]|uniref:Uncharacterized SAM-binding protein YcdF (DUF218 family) n=1 Tax=Halomonas cerina TaxID=447424 RepID=A0A839V227_9GAMM|nr:ElyC/SanA/YdcF family protein [Halomonas cerina]MBB3189412.1 uncharacterized SAM-binding protein YcdF (DUF218 family) [Halomonas cerina]
MYAQLKSLVATFAAPLPLFLALLCLAGLLALLGRRRGGLGVAMLAILALLLAAWAPVADRLLMPLETRYPPVITPTDGDIEAIVVLGGGWQAQGPGSVISRLNESSLSRLVEGIRLWRLRPDAWLVVSGGTRDPQGQPVAGAYADAARGLGVPAERLVVLDRPADTAQEAYAVRHALGESTAGEDSRLLLVTSASHMPRAMRHFQAVGLTPQAAPTHHLVTPSGVSWDLGDWVPSAQQLSKTERALHEYLGLLALEWDHRR